MGNYDESMGKGSSLKLLGLLLHTKVVAVVMSKTLFEREIWSRMDINTDMMMARLTIRAPVIHGSLGT